MLVTNDNEGGSVTEYALTTPYDVSTASFVGDIKLSDNSQQGSAMSLAFHPDNSTFYVAHENSAFQLEIDVYTNDISSSGSNAFYCLDTDNDGIPTTSTSTPTTTAATTASKQE